MQQFGQNNQHLGQVNQDSWNSGHTMFMQMQQQPNHFYPPYSHGGAAPGYYPTQNGNHQQHHNQLHQSPHPHQPPAHHHSAHQPSWGNQVPAQPPGAESVLWGEVNSNVFAASLPPTLGDKDLMDLFAPYGEIISAKVSRDLATGNSKHYGFVQFKRAQSAAAAIANLNGRNLTPTNRLHVSVAKHDETRHSGECDRLYVRNLPLWVTRDHLKGVFSEHGTVIEANVLGNKNRGSGAAVQLTVGFVRMSTVDEAKNCIRALHGSRAFDESSPVLIRFMENPSMKASRHTRKQQENEEGMPGEMDVQALHMAIPSGSQVSAHVGTPLFNSGPSSTTLSHSSTPATPVLYQVSPSTIAHQMSSVPFVGGVSPSLTAYWNSHIIPSTAATAAYSSGSIRHQVSPILIGTTSTPVVAAVLPTSGLLCNQSSEPSQSSPTIAVSTSSTPARPPHHASPFPSSGDLVFEGVYDEATLSYVIHRQTGCAVASYLSFESKQYVRLTDPSAHWHVQHELNGKPMSNETTLSVTIL